MLQYSLPYMQLQHQAHWNSANRSPILDVRARVLAAEHTQHKEHHEKKERCNCDTHTVDGQVPYKLTAANQSCLSNVEYWISTYNRYTTGKGLLKIKVHTENWLQNRVRQVCKI